jgi:hypothetical protein
MITLKSLPVEKTMKSKNVPIETLPAISEIGEILF